MPVVTSLRPEDPRRVGRYRLAGRITDQVTDQGPGTFLSRLPNGTPVAIRLLGTASAPDAASRDRFSAEARVARRVAPFCAARVLDAGFDADQPFLVSEFIEGPSLTEVIGAEGPLDGPVLTALAIGAATGLAAIHQAGLVHGDFGPDDLILGAGGPRVVRFSTTPPYGAATPSADLYSWAQTVLFAASGAAPPDLARLPDSLRGAVAACLAEQGSRPQARALLTALLGQGDPAAGLLAEGTRRARAAARGVVGPSQQEVAETPPRSAPRRAAFFSACVACVAAIAIATTLIVTHHGVHTTPAAAATDIRPSKSAPATVTASPTATPKIPTALAGTWSGTVRQTDPALAVTVRIQLAAGSPDGTIAYPQLGCSGRLLLTRIGGGSYTLEQGITSGQQSCAAGEVTLTLQGTSKLAFTFHRTGAPSPSGVLLKVNG
jgi:hypothetical protein